SLSLCRGTARAPATRALRGIGRARAHRDGRCASSEAQVRGRARANQDERCPSREVQGPTGLQLPNFLSEARQLRALENLRQPGPGITQSRSAGEDARERFAAGGDAEATFPALAAKLFVSLFLASQPNQVGTSDTALAVHCDVLDLHPQV